MRDSSFTFAVGLIAGVILGFAINNTEREPLQQEVVEPFPMMPDGVRNLHGLIPPEEFVGPLEENCPILHVKPVRPI